MSGQRREFIVLVIGNRDNESFPESTYFRLLQLIDSSAPDARVFSPRGFVDYYLPSLRAVGAVEVLVSGAETLRDSDPACAALGIGIAHGPLIADFDSHGRVNPVFLPVGVVANSASKAVYTEQIYRNTLGELHSLQKT